MRSPLGISERLPLPVFALLIAALLTLCLGSPTEATTQVDVTTCGQSFAGAGRLVADLDCTGYDDPPFGAAISIANHGTLDLNGHTLSGGLTAILCGGVCKDGVNYCLRNCTVSGGTITGPASYGIAGRNITLRNVTVSDISWWAIFATRNVTIMDSTIGGSDYAEVEGRWVKVYRSTFSGDGSPASRQPSPARSGSTTRS